MKCSHQCLFQLFLSLLGFATLGFYGIQNGILNVADITNRLFPFGAKNLQNIVFSKTSIGPFPRQNRSSCSCDGYALVNNSVPPNELGDLRKRRSEEYRQYQLRMKTHMDLLILAPSNSPLQYPLHGVTVAPLQASIIPGTHGPKYTEENGKIFRNDSPSITNEYESLLLCFEVSLSVDNGVFSIKDVPDGEQVNGQGESELTITSKSLSQLNILLSKVIYTSTMYRVKTKAFVNFSFDNHKAIFPIKIKRPSVPVLYDPGKDVNSQVTITTKTFMRYKQLNVLLDSIRQIYPEIKIIVADDSLQPENVTGKNIEHYIMPPAQGWFAGRNLAVSQVTTKYFLWVDDDFIFRNATRIERFVEIMEKVPELDVLGGAVGSNQFYFHLRYDEGNEEEGGCLRRFYRRKHQALPGFNGCFFVDGVVNFFLARTDAVQRVGFDPFLKRVAHTEFFLDGLGELLIASCKGLSVGHQSNTKKGKYRHFRFPGKLDGRHKLAHHYFKNHLKCIKF